MKVLSAKAIKPMSREFRRESRLNTMTTGQAEFARYDVTDIATDEEASKRECNCIIHSGGHKPMSGLGGFEYWSDWHDPLEGIE